MQLYLFSRTHCCFNRFQNRRQQLAVFPKLLLHSGNQRCVDFPQVIGSENTVQSMQDCSVITATYKMGDNTRGTIGITVSRTPSSYIAAFSFAVRLRKLSNSARQDCSVITATYKMGDNTRGTIGIVGPTRMDYSQVISVLNGMVQNIEKVLKNLSDGDKNT